MTNLDDYVSQAQAARILGVDASTVYRWAEQGRLTVAGRIGYTKLYRRGDVEQLRDELAAQAS
jgi:excisionase family DNA binding protein